MSYLRKEKEMIEKEEIKTSGIRNNIPFVQIWEGNNMASTQKPIGGGWTNRGDDILIQNRYHDTFLIQRREEGIDATDAIQVKTRRDALLLMETLANYILTNFERDAIEKDLKKEVKK